MPDIISWIDTLTHKLLHQRAGNVPVHAEDIVPGTFTAGTWVFDPSTAFIQIGNGYYGAHPVHGVSGTPSSNWASFGHWSKQGSSDYAFMQNAEGRSLINASAGQRINFAIGGTSKAEINSAGEFSVGSGLFRHYPSDSTYIEIKHSSSPRYQVLMRNDGNTYLDCGSGASSYVRCNGGSRFQAGPSYASIWEPEVFGSLHMRDNWIRTYGQRGWYNETYAGGIWMSDSTWVRVYGGKAFIAENELRGGSGGEAMMHRWNGSSGHAVHGHSSAGWSHGWMVRNDGAMWVMCPGTQTWRMGGSDIMSIFNSGGWADFKANLVTLSGTVVVIAGSNQFGRQSSSRRFKIDIGNLDKATDLGINQPVKSHSNPVWKMRPMRYLWNERVGNHKDVNPLFPDGIAGFIAEEIMELAPDAVTYEEPGVPANLDYNAMLAYVVGGLQHTHAGGHRRQERLNALEPRVDAIEALVNKIAQFPALKNFLK